VNVKAASQGNQSHDRPSATTNSSTAPSTASLPLPPRARQPRATPAAGAAAANAATTPTQAAAGLLGHRFRTPSHCRFPLRNLRPQAQGREARLPAAQIADRAHSWATPSARSKAGSLAS
jgi:hypothetical protein